MRKFIVSNKWHDLPKIRELSIRVFNPLKHSSSVNSGIDEKEQLDEVTQYLLTLKEDVEPPDGFTTNYLEMSDGCRLRHLHYIPENPKAQIILIPGLNTLLMSWYKLLLLLKDNSFQIDYIETREKRTSILDKPKKITYERLLQDVKESYELVKNDEITQIAIGSSMGANLILLSLARKEMQPQFAVLIGPLLDFHIPKFFRYVTPFLNRFTFMIIKPLAWRFVLPRYLNKEKDPFQAHKYELGFKLGDANKMKYAFKSWAGTTLRNDLNKIDGTKTKVILIGAEEDKLHAADETKQIAEMVQNGEYIDLKTNYAAHDMPLVKLLLELTNR